MNHYETWQDIAQRLDMSLSGLAVAAGLQPSVFAQLKRRTAGGADTYLSGENIARILHRFPDINANYLFGLSPHVFASEVTAELEREKKSLLDAIRLLSDRPK